MVSIIVGCRRAAAIDGALTISNRENEFMQSVKRLLITAAVLTLSGCATLSEEECRVGDWRTIGFEDGSVGKDVRDIGEHRKACADYGITVDLDAHRQGHEEGMVVFCQPASGFEAGASGQVFTDNCPEELRNEFYAAFEDGNRVFKLRRELNFRLQELERSEQLIVEMDAEIEKLEADLVSGEGSADDRQAWLTRIDRIKRLQPRLADDIRGIKAAIDHRQGEIDYLEARNRN